MSTVNKFEIWLCQYRCQLFHPIVILDEVVHKNLNNN